MLAVICGLVLSAFYSRRVAFSRGKSIYTTQHYCYTYTGRLVSYEGLLSPVRRRSKVCQIARHSSRHPSECRVVSLTSSAFVYRPLIFRSNSIGITSNEFGSFSDFVINTTLSAKREYVL